MSLKVKSRKQSVRTVHKSSVYIYEVMSDFQWFLICNNISFHVRRTYLKHLLVHLQSPVDKKVSRNIYTKIYESHNALQSYSSVLKCLLIRPTVNKQTAWWFWPMLNLLDLRCFGIRTVSSSEATAKLTRGLSLPWESSATSPSLVAPPWPGSMCYIHYYHYLIFVSLFNQSINLWRLFNILKYTQQNNNSLAAYCLAMTECSIWLHP